MYKCPFCHTDSERIITISQYSFAIYDKFPVARGHSLVIPKRHEADYFNLPDAERSDVLVMTEVVKNILQNEYSPDGFNIGINIGKAAGQTIFHCHIHVIPRYYHDTLDPTGGIRGVIPSKQKY